MLCSVWEMGSKWGGCGCIQGYESECVCLIVSKSLITKTKEHPNLLLDCSHGNPTNVWEALVNVSDSSGHMGTSKKTSTWSQRKSIPIGAPQPRKTITATSWMFLISMGNLLDLKDLLIFETHWINVTTYVTASVVWVAASVFKIFLSFGRFAEKTQLLGGQKKTNPFKS